MTDNNNDNSELHALQQELLQYKHDNEQLRTQLNDKTNTLNATILKKSQQIHQKEAKLKEEIDKYSKTKAVYQSIVDEHKSLKTQIHTLQNQLTQHQMHAQQRNAELNHALQSFEQRENRYKNMIGKYENDIKKLQKQMEDTDKSHSLQIETLNDGHTLEVQRLNTTQNDDNDLISLIVDRMSQQTDKRDRTQLMKCKVNDVTFTELQARFAELILAFQKEYNAHQIALSQIKQLQCTKDMKNVEIESIKGQTVELTNIYHTLRMKCSQYEAMYGDMDHMDHETLQKTLSLQHKLKQTVYELNEYRKQIRVLQDDKEKDIERRVSQQTTQISSENQLMQNKMEQMGIMCKDKDKALQRYKRMNEQLSNALLSVRQNKSVMKTDTHETEDKENNDTENDNGNEGENELELCQRMYRDQILQLQHNTDECNQERSVVEGENVKLRQQCSDWYQQNQTLNETKAYLNEIIKKQKVKCSNLNSNISEQQMYIQKLQNKYSELTDDYLAMKTQYLEIEIKHDLLEQNQANNDKENMNYRIHNVELKKLISSLKNESQAYKQQYVQINDKYKKLEEMNKKVEYKLKAIQQEDMDKNQIQKDNETLKNNIFNLKQTISDHECDINNISTQLQIAQKNESLIPNLKSEIEQLNEQINELKMNISILEQQRESTPHDMMDQDNESVYSNTSVTIGTPNRSELKQRLRELRQIAVKSQLENERLTHQIEEYQSFHNTKTRELTHQFEECNHKLAQIQRTESKQKELVHEWKDRYTKAHCRYERELKNHAHSLRNVKKLKQQIDASTSSLQSTMDISTVSTAHNESKQDLHCAVLEAEVIACKATMDRLHNENEIISSELITVKEELRKQQHNMSIEPKSQSVSSDIGIVSVGIFNTLQNKYNATQHGLDDMKHKIRDVETENKGYNTRCNTLENENKIMDEKMKRMMKQNESLKERNLLYLSTYPQIDPEDFEHAKQQVHLLTEQLKLQTDTYNEMMTQQKQNMIVLDTIQKECEGYKEQTATEKMRYKELSQLMQSTLDAVDKTKKNLKSQHRAQMEGLDNKIKAKDMMMDKLQKDVQKGKDLIGKMKALLTKKGGVITAKQQQMDQLMKEIKDRVGEMEALKMTLDKASKTGKTLQLDIWTRDKQLKDKESEYNANIMAWKEAKKADIVSLEHDKKRLMEELEKERKSRVEITEIMSASLDSHEKEIALKNEERNTLQKECTKTKQLMEKMKNILSSKQQQMDKATKEIKHRMDGMEALKVALDNASKTAKTLKSDLLRKENEYNANMMAFKAAKKADIAALENDRKQFMEDLEKEKQSSLEISDIMCTSLDSHEKEMKLKNEEMGKLQKESTKTKQLMDKMKNILSAKQMQMDKLQSSCNETKRLSNERIMWLEEENTELRDTGDDLRNRMEIQLEKLNQALQEKEKSVGSKDKEHDYYEKQLTIKSDRIQILNNDLKKIKQKYQKISQDATNYLNISIESATKQQKLKKTIQEKDKWIESLNVKLESTKKALEESVQNMKQQKDALHALKESISMKQKESEHESNKIKRWKEEYKKVYDKLQIVKAENAQWMQQKEDRQVELKQTKQELEQKNESIKSVITILNTYKTEKAELQHTNSQQIHKLSQVQHDVETLKQEMKQEDDKVKELRIIIKHNETQLNTLHGECKQYQTQIRNTQQTLEQRQDEMKTLTQTLTEKDENIKSLQQSNDTLTHSEQEGSQKMIRTQSDIHALKQRLEQMKQEHKALETNRTETETQHIKAIEELENKLKSESIKYQNIYELAQDYQKQNKSFKDTLNKAELNTQRVTDEKEQIVQELSEITKEYKGLQNIVNEKQNAETRVMEQNKVLQSQMKVLEDGLYKVKKQLLIKEHEAKKLLQTTSLNLSHRHKKEVSATKAEYKKKIILLETEMIALKKEQTDKEIRTQYNELQKQLSEVKKMLIKEKKIRNRLERNKVTQAELVSMQEKRIQELMTLHKTRRSPSKSPSKSPRRPISPSPSHKSSLYTLPAITTSTATISKKRKLDAITLDSDSDDNDDDITTNTKVPPKKRYKTDDSSSTVIDLTSESKPGGKRLKSTSKKTKSSLDGLSVGRTLSVESDVKNKRVSVTDMNVLLRKKLEKLQKRNKIPIRDSRSWCSLSVDFNENNSLDPESVDSSFPVFDIYFTPLMKQRVTNWKKPFIEMLRVSERLSYAQCLNETKFNEWIKKDKKEIPSNIGLFKCEHQLTPNRTKTNNFIQVNKLLSDKKCVGFAEYRSQYKMYFIPSGSLIATSLDKQYQKQMEVAHDRMWVIWLKK